MGRQSNHGMAHVVDSPVESVDNVEVVDVAEATAEPSLYEQVLPYLDDEQRDYLATLTPFARELQLWLWNRPGPKWSHAQLAKALGISPNTVNAWFSRGTRPEGNSYHRLKEVTGWLPAHLMALTGYVQEPPHEPSFLDFLLDDNEAALGWAVDTRGDREIIWKDGATAGYASFIGYDPVSASAVVVLSNSHNPVDDLGMHLLDSR